MVSRNLVICDQEVRYAAALAEVFMKAKELAYRYVTVLSRP